MGDTSLRRFHYLLESLQGWPGERPIEIPPEGIEIPEDDMLEEYATEKETPMPEPRSESKITIPQVQRWYDDAMEGNFTNPWLREDIGGDLDQKEDFIYNKILPLFEPSEGLRGKMRNQWKAERDQAGQVQAPPTPSPVPTMDDILTEAMGMSGQSGKNYQQ